MKAACSVVEQALPRHVVAEGLDLLVRAREELHASANDGHRLVRRIARDLEPKRVDPDAEVVQLRQGRNRNRAGYRVVDILQLLLPLAATPVGALLCVQVQAASVEGGLEPVPE